MRFFAVVAAARTRWRISSDILILTPRIMDAFKSLRMITAALPKDVCNVSSICVTNAWVDRVAVPDKAKVYAALKYRSTPGASIPDVGCCCRIVLQRSSCFRASHRQGIPRYFARQRAGISDASVSVIATLRAKYSLAVTTLPDSK